MTTTQTEVESIIWEGQSGTKYRYWIHPINQTFKATPANYIYARLAKDGWYAVYIGETGDLSERPLDEHHKKQCIERNGATHIHVHKSSADRKERLAEEADLVAKWNPTCND